MTLTFDLAAPPREVFVPWGRAQRTVDRLAREAPPSPAVLRATGFLGPELAEWVTDWFTGPHRRRPERSARRIGRSSSRRAGCATPSDASASASPIAPLNAIPIPTPP